MGYSAFSFPVIHVRVSVMAAMVEHGVDWRGNDRGAWYVHEAVRSSSWKAAAYLISIGADASHVDPWALNRIREQAELDQKTRGTGRP
jgi:hypothetical protein